MALNSYWNIPTVKWNSSGVKQWAEKYEGKGHRDDIGYAVKADANGNVYVGGTTTNGASNLNSITISYGPNGEKEAEPALAKSEDPLCLENFPNPFNTSTTITYTLPENSNVRINIYDITGKVIRELSYENSLAGSYSFQFDSEGLPSCTYVCQLIAGRQSVLRKKIDSSKVAFFNNRACNGQHARLLVPDDLISM